jgi:hypothetical protein
MVDNKTSLASLYISTKSRLLAMPVKSSGRKQQEALCSKIKNALDGESTLDKVVLEERIKEYTTQYYNTSL